MPNPNGVTSATLASPWNARQARGVARRRRRRAAAVGLARRVTRRPVQWRGSTRAYRYSQL